MLYQLSSILHINDYDELLTTYFSMLQDEAAFISVELYLFPKMKREIISYRFTNGYLYKKAHKLTDMEDTILEEQFVEKEFTQYMGSDLMQKRSLAKESYYFDEGAKMIQAYPMIEISRLNASMVLLFEDEFEIDVSDAIEFLNAKLSILFTSEELKEEKLYYQKILLNEKIFPYKVDEINDELKKHHQTAENTKKKVIKNDGKYYELTKIDVESGYLKDISYEISLRVSEQEAFRDQETRFNTLNKLKQSLEGQYSIIELQFEETYLHDVRKKALDLYDRQQLFRDENKIFVLLDFTDKRLLNKEVRSLKDTLGNIMTFEYSIGVIRVPVDVKKDPLKLLQAITDSEYEFYDAKEHKKMIGLLVQKKNVIDKISANRHELSFHPIVNTRSRLEGYFVSLGIDEVILEDKRVELMLVHYAMEQIRQIKKDVIYFIKISDALCKTKELEDLLKQYKHEQDLFKKVTLIFDSIGTRSEEYLLWKQSKIARNSVEALFKQEKIVDYLFQKIAYEDFNKEYFAFLSRLEDKGIIPVFEVDTKEELQYVIDYGIGFVYTKNAKDVLIEKN